MSRHPFLFLTFLHTIVQMLHLIIPQSGLPPHSPTAFHQDRLHLLFHQTIKKGRCMPTRIFVPPSSGVLVLPVFWAYFCPFSRSLPVAWAVAPKFSPIPSLPGPNWAAFCSARICVHFSSTSRANSCSITKHFASLQSMFQKT